MNRRFLLDPGALLGLRFLPTAAAGLVVALMAVLTPLPALARTGALATLVVSVLIGSLPRRENVKTHGAVIFAILAVAIAGLTRSPVLYPVACGAFGLLCLACLRAPVLADRLRARALPLGREGARPDEPRATAATLAVLVSVTAAVAWGLLLFLPRASAFAERQVQRYAGDALLRDDDRIGFATNIRVGSLTRLLRSDRVVMRIDGEAPELLRGAVLDEYDGRVWSGARGKSVVIVPAAAPKETGTTRIELSRAALSGPAREPRWFLPADACDLHAPSGRVGLDPYGAAHPEPPGDARDISFRRAGSGSCRAAPAAPAAPTATDLVMAAKIRAELTPIAYAWTRGAGTKQEALDALARHLAGYAYSLEDRRETSMDPVVEFLTVHRRGHCELFASAMALLARAAGIPARVVLGYRVDEVNPLTGLSVVRDRNAHAWVEAWDGLRWVTFDPTPLSELHASTRPSRLNHVAEAVSLVWDRSVSFVAHLGLLEAGVFFAFAAVVLIVIRRFSQRSRAVARADGPRVRPLPAFESLAAALEGVGLARAASEPLERFARRVRGGGEVWSVEVAEAVQRYAELRYGGLGEERTVVQELETVARRVAGPTARASPG